MIFFTADLHFGHKNIIKYCARPFRTVGEMDSTLIVNWNTKVNADDTIYILGDMFFNSRSEPEKFLERLNGKKHLILGNHDKVWMKHMDVSRYFEDVAPMVVIPYAKQTYLLTLCHYPMMCYSGDRKGSGYMIHGHIHNRIGEDYFPLIRSNPHILNAGVDVNDFKPVTFEELIKNNQKFKKSAVKTMSKRSDRE